MHPILNQQNSSILNQQDPPILSQDVDNTSQQNPSILNQQNPPILSQDVDSTSQQNPSILNQLSCSILTRGFDTMIQSPPVPYPLYCFQHLSLFDSLFESTLQWMKGELDHITIESNHRSLLGSLDYEFLPFTTYYNIYDRNHAEERLISIDQRLQNPPGLFPVLKNLIMTEIFTPPHHSGIWQTKSQEGLGRSWEILIIHEHAFSQEESTPSQFMLGCLRMQRHRTTFMDRHFKKDGISLEYIQINGTYVFD